MGIAKPEDSVEYKYKDIFYSFVYMLLDVIPLCFGFAAPNPRTVVFCLKCKTSVNWQIDFLALGFLPDTDGPGDTWLLSENPSGVETISA